VKNAKDRKRLSPTKTILTFVEEKCSTIINESMIDNEKYLRRIGLPNTELGPNLKTLKWLQKNHLLRVPFENLDIHWGTEITLDVLRFYAKIVENGRGGFCYELNGLFNELLKGIGFQTKIVSARVAGKEGVYGEEYDHLAILVKIDDDEYLADVGFGDFIAEPLKIEFDTEQRDPNGIYYIRQIESDYLEVVSKTNTGVQHEYKFKNREHDLDEFAGMCVHNQSSPESHFTQGIVCSLMTKNGRKTLTDKKFIETVDGKKKEQEIGSNKEFGELLSREFGIKQP